MGIVTFLVDAADQGLDSVARSQFAAISSGIGTAIMLAATVAIVLLFINMAFQFRPMDGTELIPLLIKIGLINAFAFNWVNFNHVSGFITDGLDNIAGMLIGSITGDTGAGSAYFAERFDQLINELADYANEIGANLNWMAGALMSVLLTALLSVVGGLAAMVLILAKMVVTLLIGLAPIMIALSMFEATKEYFHRWLSAIVSYSFYPVVIAGTFSIIFGLMRVLLSAVGDTSNLTTIGAALPFLAVVLLSLALIGAIPVVVRTISADINSGWAAAAARDMLPRPQRQLGHRGQQPRSQQVDDRSGRRTSRHVVGPNASSADDTHKRVSTGTGARMQRMKDRADRLGD